MFELINSIPLIGGTLGTLIPFLIVLSVVVFVHEFGHYIVGRWCGIEAEVFSLGFGKVLWSREDKRGTVWQVALIPMGGFVKFLGDKDAASTAGREHLEELPPEEAAKRFHTASLPRRALTVFAGPAANFILSIGVFAGLHFYTGYASDEPVIGDLPAIGGVESELQVGDRVLAVDDTPVENFVDIFEIAVESPPRQEMTYQVDRDGDTLTVPGPYPFPAAVASVDPLTAASRAGVKPDDLIIAVEGTPVFTFSDLRDIVQASADKTLNFEIMRDGQKITLPITPREQLQDAGEEGFEKRVMIGVRAKAAIGPETLTPTPWGAVGYGAERTWAVIAGSIKGIYHIFLGNVGAENLQGPLGIAQVSGETALMGWTTLISLIGVISTAIGFINLFPIPVLDGGHLITYLVEAIRGRPMNERVLHYATLVGISLLFTLMIFATFNDIIRLLST